MERDSVDILAVDRGTITAPAGCGKTQLIAEALARHRSEKPVLVLTHTNAGVAALRARLDEAGVPRSAYRLSTIDGWCMRLISTFPVRSGHDAAILALGNPRRDYPRIRTAAARLLEAGHLDEILKATYDRLLVDEYQDCSVEQHAVVTHSANALPTCVLGDPLQAIFGFGDNVLPDWNGEVCDVFPVVGELDTPWRWINVGAGALGDWLLEIRGKLLRGEPIDLRTGPSNVEWIDLDGTEDLARQLTAARTSPPDDGDRVLIIGKSTSPYSQRQFASRTAGAITVEAIDLKDFVAFAREFDLRADDALARLAGFAQTTMTNAGATALVRRVQTHRRGTARVAPSHVEEVALSFVEAPTYRGAAELLTAIRRQRGVRLYRPTVFRACIEALRVSGGTEAVSFYEVAIAVREQNRVLGRTLPRRAVGSTLLLKGLEAEVAVILNAGELDARNLYVAMTRGSKAITVCSSTPVLSPKE